MQLNSTSILSTATEILSEYGLADLSMRRLARSLGVAPGALYWHFPSKQDLLGAIANQLLDGVRVPEAAGIEQPVSTDDAEMFIGYCVEIYTALTGLRDGAEITLAALAAGTTSRDIHRELVTAAGELGDVAFHYVLGAAMELQSRQSVATALGTSPMPVPQPEEVRRGVALIMQPVSHRQPEAGSS